MRDVSAHSPHIPLRLPPAHAASNDLNGLPRSSPPFLEQRVISRPLAAPRCHSALCARIRSRCAGSLVGLHSGQRRALTVLSRFSKSNDIRGLPLTPNYRFPLFPLFRTTVQSVSLLSSRILFSALSRYPRVFFFLPPPVSLVSPFFVSCFFAFAVTIRRRLFPQTAVPIVYLCRKG